MKAAILKSFGEPLAIDTLPDPEAGAGEAVVDVVAAPVLAYSKDVFEGKRKYGLELPMAPGAGAVGRIRALGPDATRLRVGDWVLCDSTVRSRDDALVPDIQLQGLTAPTDAAKKLQKHFKHGAFAERMLLPLENAFPLGEIEPEDADRWAALLTCLVPFGGLFAANVGAGETVLVSGATGNFGSAAVAVAIALGAARVVAPGRNERVLADLVRRFGDRVRTVKLEGDEEADGARMQKAGEGAIDCVLDILPPGAPTTATRAAVMTVRPHGRVVLMGGVGQGGGPGLELPYPWLMRNDVTVRGKWMYARAAVPRAIALARTKQLDLGQFEVKSFALDHANDAVAHAAANPGAFRLTTLAPSR